jgi:hypothetical protein
MDRDGHGRFQVAKSDWKSALFVRIRKKPIKNAADRNNAKISIKCYDI